MHCFSCLPLLESRSAERNQPQRVHAVGQIQDDCLGHEFRGISIGYLGAEFMSEVRFVGHSKDCRVYDIKEDVIMAKGMGVSCPRDDRPGAAYVDCIHGADAAGLATFMLSYTWGYVVQDIVDALKQHSADAGLDPRKTYVWICCLCINQHRVKEAKEEGRVIPFEEFKLAFGKRVSGIRQVVALMTWSSPMYITRIWCVFEIYTAVVLGEEACSVTVIMPPKETIHFCESLQVKDCNGRSSGISNLWRRLVDLDVEKAASSVPQDREQILKLIDDGPGFEAVNCAVSKYLRIWAIRSSESHLSQLIASRDIDSNLCANLCAEVGLLLWEVYLNDRAMRVLQEGYRLLVEAGSSETVEAALLLGYIAKVSSSNSDLELGIETQRKALGIFRHLGLLETERAALATAQLGRMLFKSGDMDGAAEVLEAARGLHERTGTLESRDGGIVLRMLAAVVLQQGDAAGAVSLLQQALPCFEEEGGVKCPEGAYTLTRLGEALGRCDRHEDALGHFDEASRIRKKTGTWETKEGVDLLCSWAEAELTANHTGKAEEKLQRARSICERQGWKAPFSSFQQRIFSISLAFGKSTSA